MNKKLLLKKGKLIMLLSFVLMFLPSKGLAQYSGSGTFTKISSLAELTDGYYVVAYGTTFAMNNTNAGSFFANSAITPSGSNITNPSTTIVWKIQTNGGGRTIFNEASSKYVSYTGSANNSFAVALVSGDNERWTFAFSGSLFTVTNLGVAGRLLQYNNTAPRFACYTGTQQNITLYKLAASATPSITGATTATAFATTYGTPSTTQTFSVSGADLTANLVATAPIGFEVSSDGTTFGSTATFTHTSGSASGTLNVRLKASAAVTGSYNSQNIVLSSTGAASVNIATASSGNAVVAKDLTITANDRTKAYNTSLELGTVAFSASGLVNGETVGSVTLNSSEATTLTTPVGAYPINISTAIGGTFTASNYAITYTDGTLTITKADQTITALSTTVIKTYGDAHSIATTATSGLPVTYLSSDSSVATVSSDGTVTLLASGIVDLTVSQAGDNNYNSTSATQTLTVQKKALTILGLTADSKTYDGTTVATLSGTASLVGVVGSDVVALTGTPVATFTSSAVGNDVPVIVTGYSLTGASAGNYSLIQPTLSADIIATTPTIFVNGTLSALTTIYGTASTATSFALSGQTLTEGIHVAAPAGFEVSDGGAYASTITVGGAGDLDATTISVRLASTASAGTYSGNITLSSTGAANVTVATASSVVASKTLTITGLTGVDKVYDGSASATVIGTPTLNGIVDSDDVSVSGTPSFSFADANVGTTKSITVLGYVLSGTAAANYSVAQPTSLTATITKADQTIAAISDSETKTFGDETYSVATTASSGLTVTYSSSNTAVATVDASGIVSIVGGGSATITASQTGNANYNAATSVVQSLTVNKANQTLSALPTPISKTYGDASYSATSTASSGLAVTYASDNTAVATVSASGLVTIVGAGTATITASQTGNANYNAVTSVIQDLIVAKASQTITFNALANKTTTDTTFNLTATASSTLAVTYSSSNSAVATISGNIVTIVGAGTTTITASQVGNANYDAATSVNQDLTVLTVIAKWTFDAIVMGVTPSFQSVGTTPTILMGSPLVAELGLQTNGSLFSGLHASSATIWTNPAGNATTKSFTSDHWAIGDYWQFKVNTSNYYDLALSFDTTGSNTGPKDFKVQYSLTETGTFTDLPNGAYSVTNDSWSSTGNPKAVSTKSFDLSTVTSLANQSAVYIRLLCNGTTSVSGATVATGGTNRVDNFTVMGSLCTGEQATVTANGTTSFCSGDSVTLTANAGASYLWSNGAITQSIDVTATGDYTVTVTNANGCSSTSAATVVTVTESSIHTTTISACDSYTWNGTTYTTSGIKTGPTANCVTEKLDLTITPSVTLSDVTVSVCNAYTWEFDGQTYTSSGDYTSIVDCVKTTLHLTVNSAPAIPGTATIDGNSVSNVCAGADVTLSLAGSAGAIQWESSANGTDYSSIEGATQPVYTVSASNNTATEKTLFYRAHVTIGTCSTDQYSNSVQAIVSPTAMATAIIGGGNNNTTGDELVPICTTATETLTLTSGYVGTIVGWQYNAYVGATAPDNNWINDTSDVASGNTLVASSQGENLQVWYRAVLQSGMCTAVVYSEPVSVYFKDCSLSRADISNVALGVNAYPNPYAETFKLVVTTTNEDTVQVNVYDVLGKLLESKAYDVNQMLTEEIGSGYPTGVYNIVVRQGANVKTVRVVKR